jgi:hypothetical protein
LKFGGFVEQRLFTALTENLDEDFQAAPFRGAFLGGADLEP